MAQRIKQTSPMHDIGKVGIVDSILNKPGKLTEDEFELMKTHAGLGYEMLKYSQRPILKIAAIVAYTHHEKYAGGGYPNGTKGEDIPIEENHFDPKFIDLFMLHFDRFLEIRDKIEDSILKNRGV